MFQTGLGSLGSCCTGATAVEVMACTLQHPEGMHAPAAQPDQHVDHRALPLGPVPHMVRGQLSGFSQMCLTGQAFSQCTACSPIVVEQYKQHGWNFLLQALQVCLVLPLPCHALPCPALPDVFTKTCMLFMAGPALRCTDCAALPCSVSYMYIPA